MNIVLSKDYSIADVKVYNFDCSSSLDYLHIFFFADQIFELFFFFLASFIFLLVIFISFPL